MKTINFKTFEENFNDVINSVIRDNCAFKVTTKTGNIVVFSEKEYKTLLNGIQAAPNKDTLDAFKEVDDISSGKKKAKKYSNVEELKKDLKIAK